MEKLRLCGQTEDYLNQYRREIMETCKSCGGIMSAISFFVEPNIIMTRHGEFLATTPRSSPLRIGVIGKTEDDARHRFELAIKRWRETNEKNLEASLED